MKKILFTGHISFANRGTEAIIRSLCTLIQQTHNDVYFIIPSDNPKSDREIWGEDHTVEFVELKISFFIRFWTQFTRLKFLQRLIIRLSPKLNSQYRRLIDSADIIFSVGGDMYTFEGRFPLWIYLSDRYAQLRGKKVFLIGATISNFENKDHKNILIKHFEQFEEILVRDTASFERLKKYYRIENVTKTSDSAFWLTPKTNSYVDGVFNEYSDDDVKVGINISPLLERLGDPAKLKKAIEDLITNNPRYKYILIPHVFVRGNDDLEYLKSFKNNLSCDSSNVEIIDELLSSQELKYAISKLDIFLGARTHATIAAFSSGIPVICLAYSDKAFGISKDVYGTEEYVVRFQDIDGGQITSSVDYLLNFGDDIVDKGLISINQLKLQCKDNLSRLDLS